MTPDEIYATGAKVKVYKGARSTTPIIVFGPPEELVKVCKVKMNILSFRTGDGHIWATETEEYVFKDAVFVPPPQVKKEYLVYDGNDSFLGLVHTASEDVKSVVLAWDDICFSTPHDVLNVRLAGFPSLTIRRK
jgi:hypothetical protein